MIQQSHFWVYIQRKREQDLGRDICTLMFTAALFTIIKMWKQPNSADE